jgi:hypothetical protein
MRLTATQQEQLQRAKQLGERRLFVQLTEEQRAAWRDAAEQELAGKDDNVAQLRKIVAAADQPGFFGDIRRSILLSRRPIGELAIAIGVEPRALSDFRAGDRELPAVAIDRLVEVLGLRLMQDIPR